MSGKGEVRAPRLARSLVRWMAPAGRTDDVMGDLEEGHRRRAGRRGRIVANALTSLETIDVLFALLRGRIRQVRSRSSNEAGGEPGRGASQSRDDLSPAPLGRRIAFSWLDVKLGLRMLVRYPGLTLVGGLAMAFAIWVGAVTFEIVDQMLSPELPLEDGDRIVGIQNVDVEAGRPALPFLEDLVAWRTSLTTVEGLGAFRSVARNLITGEAGYEPVLVAEMSAAGFEVARVPPLLGRPLADADEEPGAPPVVVIGHDVWQTRFGGDPEVVGRTVRVGRATSTVVGVMPDGFAFPLHHGVWVPLRRATVDLRPGEGGRVAVFGRLAPGRTMEEAQAELDVLGARRAAAHSEALGQVRPRVLPYARSVRPLPDVGPLGLLAANLFMVMLLVLVCGNVALLMFARAATRERELAVRSALGASRGRIVAQLFAEALVLGGVAALIGLVGAGFGVRWHLAMSQADSGGLVPFWTRDGLSFATVAYACGLTLLAAAGTGIGPALKVTGHRVESRLRRAAAGSGGLQLSGVWTVVIVAQVAVTVAFPATAFFFQRYVTRMRSLDLGFPAERYLALRLEMDVASGTGRDEEVARAELVEGLAAAQRELEERLASEPEVAGVTFANRLPGARHPQPRIQVEEPGVPTEELRFHRVAEASVGVGFFRALETPVLAGRSFDSGDPESVPGVVIVNQAFVDEILDGRSPVGRRVRHAVPAGEELGPWHEIVGVAADLGMIGGDGYPRDVPGVYHPLAWGVAYPLDLAIHVRGEPEAFTSRLRTLAAGVDPGLRLHEVRRLDRISESRWRESEFLYRLLGGVSLVALVLSLSGIYSVLSFTVSRRTREIGVRVALGAEPRSVVVSIFRRPVTHVLMGIAVGAVLVCLLSWGITGGLTPREAGLVGLYAALMFGVCTFACVVPTRRALRVEPTEALRAEA